MSTILPCNLKPRRTVRIPESGSTIKMNTESVIDIEGRLIFQVMGAGTISIQFQPAFDDNAARSYNLICGQIFFLMPRDLVNSSQVQFSTSGATDGLVTFFDMEEPTKKRGRR